MGCVRLIYIGVHNSLPVLCRRPPSVRPSVRSVWRTNDYGGKMPPRSEIRAWIGHMKRSCDTDLIDERARRRYPGFDRLDIYSTRDHPFSSQGDGGGGGGDTSLLLRFPWLGSLVENLSATEIVVFLSVATSSSINGEWISFLTFISLWAI